MQKTIPQISLESQALIKKLATVTEGETISYGELSTVIGRDVTSQGGRGSLFTARHRLERDEGIFFEPVRGVGLRRCCDLDKASSGPATVKKIGAAARRGARKLAAVENFDALPNEVKIEHNASLSMLGALAQASTVKKLTAVRSAVSRANDVLPMAKTLEALKG